jgi:hypothetical protein
MTRRILIPLLLAGVIAAFLSGGYAIVARNVGGADSGRDTPSGFIH